MAAMDALTYTLEHLARVGGCEVEGDPSLVIHGFGTLQHARIGQISFLANALYEKQLAVCKASAVILHPDKAGLFSGAKLLTQNPYAAYARISALFDIAAQTKVGIHPTAAIDPEARLADDVYVGPHAVIERGAEVGRGCHIGAGAFIGENSKLGEAVRVSPNVTIYHGVTIGDRTIIHSAVVIGADGFGFAPTPAGWIKVHQLGGVRIGSDTEIGAGTTIDRGAIEDTVVGNNVIIDNQVQIAHNCEVGDGTAMVAKSGIAGSTRIGRNCILGGRVGIAGHLEICDGTTINAHSMVTKSIKEPGVYSGGMHFDTADRWRRNSARFRQLDDMARRVSRLEKAMAKDD